jgi:hypothetical protein
LALPLASHAGTYTFESSSLGDLAHGTAYTWGLTSTTTGTSLSSIESMLKADDQVVKSATLTLTGVSDWTDETGDVLYVDILNGLRTGVNSTDYDNSPDDPDTSFGTDPFKSGTTNNWELTHTSGGYVQYTAPTTYTSALIAPITGATYVSSTGSDPTSSAWTNPSGDPGTFSAYNTTSSYTVTYTLSSANVSLLTTLIDDDANTSTDLGLGFGPDCHFYDSGVTLSFTTGPQVSVPDGGATLAMLGAALVALIGFKLRFKRPAIA